MRISYTLRWRIEISDETVGHIATIAAQITRLALAIITMAHGMSA